MICERLSNRELRDHSMVDMENLRISFLLSDLCRVIVISSLSSAVNYRETQSFFTGVILLPPMSIVFEGEGKGDEEGKEKGRGKNREKKQQQRRRRSFIMPKSKLSDMLKDVSRVTELPS